jgi:KaiC/GvpD/RAD55 family RecA-like ATPase
MKEEQAILKALLSREYWDAYGELLAPLFSDPAVPGTSKLLYRAIETHWTQVVEGTQLPLDLLRTYAVQLAANQYETNDLQREIESIGNLELGEDLNVVLLKAVTNHAVSEVLINAQRKISLEGEVDLYDVMADLQLIENRTTRAKILDLFSLDNLVLGIEEELDCQKFPTEFPSLDKMLNGGLWASEIGVLLGEVHIGKTWALTYLGSRALLQGTPVIHFTGEITKARTFIRYYQSLLGMDRLAVMAKPTQVREALGDLQLPPWCVVDFSNRAYNTHQLRYDVMRFCQEVEKPPLIIVDYIDKLKSADRRLEGRFALTDITEYLRRIACEVEGGLWTASQVGRVAYGEMYVRKENVAEAIGKVEIADIIVTLNQTNEEKRFDQMRWLVEKARERVLPPQPEVVLRCHPAMQSFEENVQASQDQFDKWTGGTT